MLLAEQLVGEARERRKRGMSSRERHVVGTSAAIWVCAAAAIALFVPSERAFDIPLVVGLTIGYAVVSRVRFEFAEAYVSAEQLVFVPMLLLLPLPLVPALVAGAALIAHVPDFIRGEQHLNRWMHTISGSWFAIGPVLVLAALAPGQASASHVAIYVLAFGAEMACESAWMLIHDRFFEPLALREFFKSSLTTLQLDGTLSALAFVVTLVAVEQPIALLVIAPLVWLLHFFSDERQKRYTATLDLNRAYRGTVMLLTDVVAFEDGYTADHSRSVVELVQAVAKELDVDPNGRQEMEFAAMLHDVGKISIPKEILNKPAKLTDDEFELMKTHTIEGQFMLDRVGGLLARVGEIVRSCHERWDGKGYPDGLAGEEIPLTARIVFVCDAYNAMTTTRPYRTAMSQEEACRELVENAGTQFDPAVVAALSDVIERGDALPGMGDSLRALVASVQMPDGVAAA